MSHRVRAPRLRVLIACAPPDGARLRTTLRSAAGSAASAASAASRAGGVTAEVVPAAEVLQRLLAATYDVVVLSRRDGAPVELLREIRARGLETPVLMLTLEPPDEAALADTGATEWLPHDVTGSELLRAMRHLVRCSARFRAAPPPQRSGVPARLERIMGLVVSAPLVLYACEADGQAFACTFISDNVRDHVGWAASAFLDDPSFWRRHLHPDDAASVLADLASVVDREGLDLSYRFRVADGSWCVMRDEVRVVRDAGGRAVAVVGCWANVGYRGLVTAAGSARPARGPRSAASGGVPAAVAGRSEPLTVRQREVLRLIAEGHGTRGIAAQLELSVKTVETHRAHIMQRLRLHDVASLVRYAIRVRLVSMGT